MFQKWKKFIIIVCHHPENSIVYKIWKVYKNKLLFIIKYTEWKYKGF